MNDVLSRLAAMTLDRLPGLQPLVPPRYAQPPSPGSAPVPDDAAGAAPVPAAAAATAGSGPPAAPIAGQADGGVPAGRPRAAPASVRGRWHGAVLAWAETAGVEAGDAASRAGGDGMGAEAAETDAGAAPIQAPRAAGRRPAPPAPAAAGELPDGPGRQRGSGALDGRARGRAAAGSDLPAGGARPSLAARAMGEPAIDDPAGLAAAVRAALAAPGGRTAGGGAHPAAGASERPGPAGSSEALPAIQVTIGRIEVRAVAPAPARPAARRPAASSAPPLEEYLKQGSRGGP